jgi:LemA protein
VIAVLAISAVTVIWAYNRLVTLRNRYLNALSQIDVQLKRRHDLVPNLVESARAYLAHEQNILGEIARLRAQTPEGLGQNSLAHKDAKATLVPPTALIENDLALSRAVGRLTAVMESYPDLKANATIAELMEDLSSAENRVSFARQAYNDAVMEYNQYREAIPSAIFASKLGFAQAWFWWSDPAGRANPLTAKP